MFIGSMSVDATDDCSAPRVAGTIEDDQVRTLEAGEERGAALHDAAWRQQGLHIQLADVRRVCVISGLRGGAYDWTRSGATAQTEVGA
eukprot:933267-Rhodomonas_salina.2